MFGGELDVTEETLDPFETDKSQVRQYRDWLYVRNEKQLEILKKVESALEKMESFSRTKKNMHLPIRDGIQEAKKELGALRYDTVCYLHSFEYLMRGLMVKKIKEVKPPKPRELLTRVAKPSHSRLRGPRRTHASGHGVPTPIGQVAKEK